MALLRRYTCVAMLITIVTMEIYFQIMLHVLDIKPKQFINTENHAADHRTEKNRVERIHGDVNLRNDAIEDRQERKETQPVNEQRSGQQYLERKNDLKLDIFHRLKVKKNTTVNAQSIKMEAGDAKSGNETVKHDDSLAIHAVPAAGSDVKELKKPSYPLPGIGGQPSHHIVNPHEFERLINEKEACREKPDVLIYVHASVTDVTSRQLIRDTWGRVTAHHNVTFQTLFMLGRARNYENQHEILNESARYHDVIQEDFIDHYRNLTYKNVMGLKWSMDFCPSAKMVVKTDVDVIINIFKLAEFYTTYEKQGRLRSLIYCSVFRHYHPRRDKGDKWFVTYDEYPHEYYPDHCEGLGYVISADVIPRLYNASLYTAYYWIDDVYITGFLARNTHISLMGFDYRSGFGYVTVYNSQWNYREQANKNIFILFKYVKSHELWKQTWNYLTNLRNSTMM